MRKIYRPLSLLLALLMAWTLIPVGVAAEADREQLTIVSAAASSKAANSLGAENMIDGRTDNFWSSARSGKAATNTAAEWTLSEACEVSEVRLMPRVANGAALCFPSGFVLQYSLNGSDWATVPGGDISGYAATTDWQVFTFTEPVVADRVRAVSTVCTAEGNNYYFQLVEVQVYGNVLQEEVPETAVLPILDFSSSKTAADALSAKNLVDGDLTNFWSTSPSASATPASPGYFDLTFAAPSVITELQLMPRVVDGEPTCFPSAFKLQYSLGGSAWADVPGAAFSGYMADTQWQNITLPTPVKADKLRVIGTTLGTDPHGNYYFQLAEVQVLGYTDGEVPPAKAYGEIYYVSDAVSTTGLTEQALHDEAVYVGCEDNGSKIVFTNVDFGEGQTLSIEMGVTGWYGNLRHFSWEDAVLDVYLDNMASTPVAKVYVDYDEETYEQTAAIEALAADFSKEISGVHNVVIAFRGDESAFQWMRLRTEDAAPNAIELREQAYLEKQPDMTQLTDLMSDTWGGTDMLGRKIETNETDESTYEEDKIVGMFMWDWHLRKEPVHNVAEILKTPGALDEYPADGAAYAWDEPIYGFYQSFDEWVIRQQGELLADAGVDVIFFDTTNFDWTFKSGYLKFFKVYNDILNDGAKMPKISFILPFSSSGYTTRDLVSLYENIYEKGLYEECWFYWNGKPLILNGAASTNPAYINDFFSFKKVTSTYVNKVTNPTDRWAWLELYPQNQYVDSEGRTFMTVGVAQNHNGKRLCAMNAGDDVLGRTMTRNADGTFTRHTEEGALLKGYNFQQQFDRAIETDTDFIFITGWNEWIAGRFENWEGTHMAHPDQYNPEYSRDLEPSKGVLKDAYYCQLVENVRRFKGTRPVPTVTGLQTVSVDGAFGDWDDANTYYTYVNNIQDRDCGGYPGYYYTNTSGRNDLTLAKAAMDSEYAYFYVQTMDDMVGMNEESFMQLFLNVDRDVATGWEGYDFMLNRAAPTAETMTLERCTGGFNWEKAADISYVINGNELELAIPLEVLGISAGEANVEFKWMDNALDMENPDIMSIYTEGDAAPGSRFNYILKADDTLQTEVDQLAAADVDAAIAEIGEVTMDSKDTIEAARAAYEALTDTAKALVTRLAELEAAELYWNTVNNAVSLSLTGADSVNVIDEEVVYTLSAKGMNNLATMAVTVELSKEYLSEPVAASAEGWMIVAQVWKDGVLNIVIANNAGANGDGDILTITAKVLEQAGTATVSVTNAELGAYLGDAETFVKVNLDQASVTTVVECNVFDVNKDGVVDLRDITRAQRYYGTDHADCDVNKDSIVNVNDLILILNNYSDLFD